MLFDDPENEFPASSEERRNRQEMRQIPGPIRQAPRRQARNYNRPPNWRLVILIIVFVIVLLLGSLWGYLFFHLQSFTSFTAANNEVARITVLQSREGLHELSIQVTRFDANGYQKPDPHPYLIQGDKVELKYEYVTLPDWLGLFGLHSGYIIMGLEGYYNNGTTGTYQSLGTPDKDQSPLVSPQYGSITIMPGRNAHTLHISSKGQLEP